MTYKEYVEAAAKLLKEHPEYAELQVIHASYPEGNSYHEVNFPPSAGIVVRQSFSYDFVEVDKGDTPTAVCIN